MKREKQIVTEDDESRGREEFVVFSVIEERKGQVAQGLKQCLLAMFDMWMNNKQEWEENNGKGGIIAKVIWLCHDWAGD